MHLRKHMIVTVAWWQSNREIICISEIIYASKGCCRCTHGDSPDSNRSDGEDQQPAKNKIATLIQQRIVEQSNDIPETNKRSNFENKSLQPSTQRSNLSDENNREIRQPEQPKSQGETEEGLGKDELPYRKIHPLMGVIASVDKAEICCTARMRG